MGTLIGMTIPLNIVIIGKLADHTYVECTGGKTWKCWGRSAGGRNIASGSASTKRADAIATQNGTASNQCAGLQLYLVNGVCHQAANRILIQTGKTIKAAHGYWLSSSLFGPYGRVLFWPVSSPFDKYASVNGDLSECIDSGNASQESPPLEDSPREKQYFKEALDLYDKAESVVKEKAAEAMEVEDVKVLQMELFKLMIDFRLGSALDNALAKNLEEVREKTESVISENETTYRKEEKSAIEFVDAFNEATIKFQDEMANTLNAEEYQMLFDQKREAGDHLLLADPEILTEAYKIDTKQLKKWDTLDSGSAGSDQ
jgi:hypothetical protein